MQQPGFDDAHDMFRPYRIESTNVQPCPDVMIGADETVLDLFYTTPCNETRARAAKELYNRGWFYHTDREVWLMQVPDTALRATSHSLEMGTYFYYDANCNCKKTADMLVHYDQIEGDPFLVCALVSRKRDTLRQVFDQLAQAGSLDSETCPVGHEALTNGRRIDLSILLDETVLYLFYNALRDTTRTNAAQELYNRRWSYHSKLDLWLKLCNKQDSKTVFYYDVNLCCKGSCKL